MKHTDFQAGVFQAFDSNANKSWRLSFHFSQKTSQVAAHEGTLYTVQND